MNGKDVMGMDPLAQAAMGRASYERGEGEDHKDRYLTFKVGAEEYGIPIAQVIEIASVQKISSVPDMPRHILGVMNLRGIILPVLDVKQRFAAGRSIFTDRTCIIVVEHELTTAGLIVEEILEVLTIPEAVISPPPSIQKGISGVFIRGLGKTDTGVKILLDMEKLLHARAAEAQAAAKS